MELSDLEIVRFVGKQFRTHVVRSADHCCSHVSRTVQNSTHQTQTIDAKKRLKILKKHSKNVKNVTIIKKNVCKR